MYQLCVRKYHIPVAKAETG